jgi:hypothetical protein
MRSAHQNCVAGRVLILFRPRSAGQRSNQAKIESSPGSSDTCVVTNSWSLAQEPIREGSSPGLVPDQELSKGNSNQVGLFLIQIKTNDYSRLGQILSRVNSSRPERGRE